MTMAELTFDQVTVQYPIYNARSQSLRNQLVRISTGGKLSAEAGSVFTVTALSNTSFSLQNGDAIGLIGHNGAGKTTLLRTMAGIYAPVRGTITRKGRISTIIEIGAGIDMELSGYENIFRMGLLLGSAYKEIKAMISDIEAFTELGNFLNMPVRIYSSGMTMRLMFAVATAIHPEILLIDEMFGTGDAEFQEKATQRMKQLIAKAKIFVFASHNHALLKQYCKRIFKLEHGTVQEIPLSELS
jgi:ABC-type polysaccharide/polyol phosphate transport system ATPase subunit